MTKQKNYNSQNSPNTRKTFDFKVPSEEGHRQKCRRTTKSSCVIEQAFVAGLLKNWGNVKPYMRKQMTYNMANFVKLANITSVLQFFSRWKLSRNHRTANKRYGHWDQNCGIFVRSTVYESWWNFWKIFLKKTYKFAFFYFWTKFPCDLIKVFSTGLSKLHSTCADEYFERLFWKNLWI